MKPQTFRQGIIHILMHFIETRAIEEAMALPRPLLPPPPHASRHPAAIPARLLLSHMRVISSSFYIASQVIVTGGTELLLKCRIWENHLVLSPGLLTIHGSVLARLRHYTFLSDHYRGICVIYPRQRAGRGDNRTVHFVGRWK